jgi:hypothetical protein
LWVGAHFTALVLSRAEMLESADGDLAQCLRSTADGGEKEGDGKNEEEMEGCHDVRVRDRAWFNKGEM